MSRRIMLLNTSMAFVALVLLLIWRSTVNVHVLALVALNVGVVMILWRLSQAHLRQRLRSG